MRRALHVLIPAALTAVMVVPAMSQVRLGPGGASKPSAPETRERKGPPVKPPRKPAAPTVHRVVITPAAEPDLPLKYLLLPPYEKRKAGNSVPFYYRAILSLKDQPKDALKPFWDNYDRWMDASPAKFPKEKVKPFLKKFGSMFAELKIAAHREKTDWSWRLQDETGLEAISFLLPEVQEVRSLARLLVLKIRLEIAEGRYDDAVGSLQIGYRLSRDVAKPPTLINALVGIAIASLMDAEVLRMAGAPDAPNLYWALSKLPRPLIDMQPAMQYEMALPMKMFPSLKDAETADHSPEEWGRILGDAFLKLEYVNVGVPSGRLMKKKLISRLGMAGLAMRGYPRAKRDLIKWGYDAKRVEAMPVGQVIAIHQARTYRYMYQEQMKWSHLPYYQARAGIARSEARLKEEGYFGSMGQTREILPLAALLLPAVSNAQMAGARLDSKTAGLQVLEAIRMYAAANDGALPKDLGDIKQVPVPKNPLTDEPFPYTSDGRNAVLLIPAPQGQPARVGWQLEISVRKKATN